MALASQQFDTIGTTVQNIPVSISFRIIELFSAGLYSSANKALEELVANSYDAMAERVDVLVPPDATATGAAIWVVDDGESMNLQGLANLWAIARSEKRVNPNPNRPPIGKFGIGKLATFVLAQKLTHITCQAQEFLAVTMDYSSVDPTREASAKISLPARQLTQQEVRAALEPMRSLSGGTALLKRLLDGPPTARWTVAIMSHLKPKANQIQHGRLRWILSTALPLNPNFTLHLNGHEVESSRERLQALKTWQVGVEDKAAEQCKHPCSKDDAGAFVEIDGIGPIRGTASLYEEGLTKGKAAEWGRSHGFFIMIRGRLVNLDDALFGLPALSHGPFSRFRMEVHADGLDTYLTSGRESVQETAAVRSFKSYLNAFFNIIRAHYDNHVVGKPGTPGAAAAVQQTSRGLSARPLVQVIEAQLRGRVRTLHLTSIPTDLDDAGVEKLLKDLESEITEDGIFKTVELVPLGVDRPIAAFEIQERRAAINTLHPFFANYVEHYSSTEPFELLGVAEILTEAFLLAENVDEGTVRHLLFRRDQFLRELVAGRRSGPGLIAQNLLDKKASAQGLEDAVKEALQFLGFDVTPMGGPSKPDGLAAALLGVPSAERAGSDNFIVAYDAKATGKPQERVAAKTVGCSTLVRHRSVFKAQYSLVVAPDYEGADIADSALTIECREHNITPMRVKDLALLVWVSTLKQIGFRAIRGMLENCRTPNEVHEWVVAQWTSQDKARPPIEQVLTCIAGLMGKMRDPVVVGHVQLRLNDNYGIDMREVELVELIRSIGGLVPGFLTYSVENKTVSIEMSVSKMMSEIARHQRLVPQDVIDESFIKPLLD